jgi:hypothetical protein
MKSMIIYLKLLKNLHPQHKEKGKDLLFKECLNFNNLNNKNLTKKEKLI